MKLPPSMAAVLQKPTAAAVWALRGDLLGLDVDPAGRSFRLLAEMHRYLDCIETGTASRDHSERASKMEIGSLFVLLLVDSLVAAVDD